mgnify:FL=1
MDNIGKMRERAGIAAVEFALIAPLLVLLLVAVLEWGWLFYNLHEVTGAARRGARIGIRPYATNAECLGAIAGVMNAAGFGDTGYTVTFSPADVSSAYTGGPLQVEISVPYQQLALTGGAVVPVPDNLHASVTMAKEGP